MTEFDFPSFVSHELREKQEPNLWHPPSRNHENRPIFNKTNWQSLISAIFRKVGNDSFGLSDADFEVSLDTDLSTSWEMLGGRKVIILWNLLPRYDKNFDEAMRECLSRVKSMKHPVAIETIARLKARQSEVPATEHLKGVPASETEVELYMLAKVIHRPTGLVSIQYCKQERGKTWTRLMAQGRYELRQGLDVIRGKDESPAKAG